MPINSEFELEKKMKESICLDEIDYKNKEKKIWDTLAMTRTEYKKCAEEIIKQEKKIEISDSLTKEEMQKAFQRKEFKTLIEEIVILFKGRGCEKVLVEDIIGTAFILEVIDDQISKGYMKKKREEEKEMLNRLYI